MFFWLDAGRASNAGTARRSSRLAILFVICGISFFYFGISDTVIAVRMRWFGRGTSLKCVTWVFLRQNCVTRSIREDTACAIGTKYTPVCIVFKANVAVALLKDLFCSDKSSLIVVSRNLRRYTVTIAWFFISFIYDCLWFLLWTF